MSHFDVDSLPDKRFRSAGDEHDRDHHHVDARTGPTQSDQAVAERQLKPGRAAERLHVSVRQIERLVMRYRADGARGLVSGKRARTSNHRLPDGVAQRALALIRERYADFGPTLACEKLRECHGIELAVETIRSLMTAAGLWVPRKQRLPRIHQPRNRRACLGELIQIDGSDHRWFEARGTRQSDAAGPAGQGVALARHQHLGGGQCL